MLGGRGRKQKLVNDPKLRYFQVYKEILIEKTKEL
jgi:hypothetical protein